MGLFAQIQAFFLTLILGVVAGFIFHYYQVTIRNLPIGRYLLYLMDFILCIIMIFIMATALLLINQGEIRVYVFIALIAGGGAYYKYVSRKFLPPVQFLGRSTAFLLKRTIALIRKPLVMFINWLRKQYRNRKLPPLDNSE